MRCIYSLLFVLMLGSCSVAKHGVDGAEVLVYMKKTSGRGMVSAYEVTIMDDGKVLYNGSKHVKETGEKQRLLSKSEVKGLVAAFEAADFFSFEDEYTAKVTDLPTTYLTFSHKGRSKQIRDYYNAPAVLKELEALVEDVVAVWVE